MIKDQYKVIILAFVAAATFWVVDTTLDSFVLNKQPFLDLLIFNLPRHEIYIRSIETVLFVLFSLLIARYMARAKKSETRYRQLFTNINDAIFVTPVSKQIMPGKFVEVNDEACRRLGYTREELLQLTPADINSPEDIPLIPERAQRLLDAGHVLFETVYVTKDGRRIPSEVNVHLLEFKGKPTVLAIARDITARRQALEALEKAHGELEQRVVERTAELTEVNRQLLRETAEHRQTAERLQESELRFRTLFQTAGSVIIFTDVASRIQEFNGEAERVFGWPRHEVLGRNAVELLVPLQSRDQAEAGREQVLAGQKVRGSEFPMHLRDGTERLFLWNANLLHDGQGQAAGIIVVGHDITERKKAEEIVAAERQRFFALLDSLPAYIYLYAADYSCAFVNRYFREHFGAPGAKPCYSFLHGCPELCEGCPTLKTFQDGTAQEWEWTTGDGRTYQLYDHPLTDVDGSSIVLEMGVDITARKKAEEALKESEQRMRYLTTQLLTVQEDERRRMSQELHDELGQTLLGMKLRISSLKDQLQKGKPRKDQKGLVEDCDHLLQYLQEMVESVRRLSRDLSPAILEDLGLSAAIRNLFDDFCQRHQHIQTCSFDLDAIDDVLPKQDQINIYRICQESLTNIGKHSGATRLWLTIKKEDEHISFVLADNGRGFDLDGQSGQIPGKGLGLATLDERVRILGGALRLESKKDGGTRIMFEIPVKENSGAARDLDSGDPVLSQPTKDEKL